RRSRRPLNKQGNQAAGGTAIRGFFGSAPYQSEQGKLRRAVEPQGSQAAGPPADVHYGLLAAEDPRGIAGTVATGSDNRPDKGQTNLPPMVMPGQRQVEPKAGTPTEQVGGVEQGQPQHSRVGEDIPSPGHVGDRSEPGDLVAGHPAGPLRQLD